MKAGICNEAAYFRRNFCFGWGWLPSFSGAMDFYSALGLGFICLGLLLAIIGAFKKEKPRQ